MMKRLLLSLAMSILLVLPVFSELPGTHSAVEIFVPRHLSPDSPYLVPANVALGMLLMVALVCLLTGLRSREKSYLYLGLFYVGAFINAVGNLYLVFLVPTVEPYIGSWIMVFFSVLFFGAYLGEPVSRVARIGGGGILVLSALFILLMVLQEIVSESKWETLNAAMDFVAGLTMVLLLSWLLTVSMRGSAKGRNLLVFESIIVLGGISAMGVFKRAVIGLDFVPPEILEGNFLFLTGIVVNGFLFIHLLNRGYAELKVSRALAERENRELKELDRAKTDFMMNVSHEFKTPITIIDGILRQLKEGRWGDSISANFRHLDTIERNNLRLFRQVSNLLELARLEQHRIEPTCRRMDLSGWLRAVAAEFKPLAEQKGIFLESKVSKRLELVADPALLESAVLNLVSNAMRHTPSGGSISLDAAREEAGICLSVSDTGSGIPVDMKESVFERFRRGSGTDDDYSGGTGIGLSLVKEIMDRHGGKVELESRLGEGTRLRLIFPAGRRSYGDAGDAGTEDGARQRTAAFLAEFDRPAAPAEGDDTQKAAGEAGWEADTVLLVEDNMDLSSYLKTEMESFFLIRQAADGLAALDSIEQCVPDLIISDVMMPHLDGYGLYQRLQENESYRRIPFLFLTARSDPHEKLEALKNGAVDYIEKPFRVDELIARTGNIIAANRKARNSYGSELKTALVDFIDSFREGESESENTSRFEVQCRLASLTARESEIAGLLRKGLSDKEIASELGLSVKTVGNHNTAVFRKMGVSGRLELATLGRD